MPSSPPYDTIGGDLHTRDTQLRTLAPDGAAEPCPATPGRA
jgi:hypothetical protein